MEVPRSHVITPNREDVIESRLRLRYSATCDTYYRDWDDGICLASKNVYPGWERGIFALDSVNRKVDEDAGQVYFDRLKGSTTGFIKWQFEFSQCGLLVDEITMRINYVEGYGGEITTTLTGNAGDKRVRHLKGGEYETYSELQNSSTVTLVIHFIGEQDQVTKLFPQRIIGGMGYPLDIQFRLKPPLESLGRPRILLGLMYSSAQESEVDSRHYKEVEYAHRGRGFLHIHVHTALDLPSSKNKTRDTVAKCYLLPHCKKAKCKTRSRKGKDPCWNEDFLIVGVDFLKIRRQALELCLMNSNKKSGFIGGVRLSLGHQKVMDEQAERAAKVLKAFGSKRVGNIGKEEAIMNEINGKHSIGGNYGKKGALNGDIKSKHTEHESESSLRPSAADAKAVHPSLSTEEIWNITSIEELRALDSRSLRGLRSQHGSVDGSLRGLPSQHASVDALSGPNGSTVSSSTVTVRSSSVTHSCFLSVDGSNSNQGGTGRRLSSAERRKELSLVRQVWFTSNANLDDSASHCSSQTMTEKCSTEASTVDIANKESECDGAQGDYAAHANTDAAQDAETIKKNYTEETEKVTECEADDDNPRGHRRSSASCMTGIGKRWTGTRSDRRHSESNGKNDANGVERELLDKMMLDAVGLEVTQWENVVNKPKKWHYCWQFLRHDMIPLHLQYSTANEQNRS